MEADTAVWLVAFIFLALLVLRSGARRDLTGVFAASAGACVAVWNLRGERGVVTGGRAAGRRGARRQHSGKPKVTDRPVKMDAATLKRREIYEQRTKNTESRVPERLCSVKKNPAEEAAKAELENKPLKIEEIAETFDELRIPAGVRYHYPSMWASSRQHKGQRKLMLSEVQMLNEELKSTDEPAKVIYIGAAHGSHLPFLAQCFPGLTFDLFDPSQFASPVYKHPHMRVYQQYFTDEIAKQWSGKVDFVISDFRRGEGDTKEEAEQLIKEDMEMQMRWVEMIRPQKAALLKMRLPYNLARKPTHESPKDPHNAKPEEFMYTQEPPPVPPPPEDIEVEYLDGRHNIQIYPPKNSTESRLHVRTPAGGAPYPKKTYSANWHEDVCFYYSRFVREFGRVDVRAEPEKSVAGRVEDGMITVDEALETRVWRRYLELPGPKVRDTVRGLWAWLDVNRKKGERVTED